MIRTLVRDGALLAAATLALAGCSKSNDAVPGGATPSAPVAAVPPPAGQAWTDVVQATPEGGMRMGNPDAPVKIAEYASFTCPHCKRFDQEAGPTLRDSYIKSGRVSWEFRPMLIHGAADTAASLLALCRGPGPFFTIADQLFANQDGYLDKLQAALTPAEQQRLQGLPAAEQLKVFADKGGLYPFFAARGLPSAKAEACLADPKLLDGLTRLQERASNQDNVSATPTFFLNGQMQAETSTWAQLEPKLKAAVGG